MRLRTKVSWFAGAATALASVLVAAGILSINLSAGIDVINDRLNSLVTSVKESGDDPLTYSLLAVESQEVTLAFKEQNGDLTILQEAAGPLDQPHIQIKTIDLGFGEELIFGLSEEHLYVNLQNSLLLSSVIVLFATLLALFVSWFLLGSEVRAINKLIANASEIANGHRVRIEGNNGSRELDSLADSLEAMVETLESSKKQMQDFLWDVSHELRTPLTVLRGYLDILAKHVSSDDELAARAVERTQGSVIRMQALVQDLLLLAELGESSRYTTEPLMISEVLDGWVDDLKTLQPERVIEVTNTQTRPVSGSRELFEQLFTNVFSNLKSHTDASDRVQIVVGQNADGVSITVDDAGPGMERLLDGAVIDRFERFDVDHAKKPGSSGLGLSIMARIVELHGGTMTMTRSVLGGVRLSVQIPDGQTEELSKVSNRESSATP